MILPRLTPGTTPELKGIGFLVGTGRCGTTIVSQVLNAHSSIAVPPEIQFLVGNGSRAGLRERVEEKGVGRFSSEELIAVVEECCPYRLEEYCDYRAFFRGLEYPRRDLRSLLHSFFSFVVASHGQSIIVKQTPWYGQHLDELGRLFPGMKVIHMIRDGRDVAVSFSRTPWWSRDVKENIERWEREILRIHEYCAAHPDRCLEVRYEDIVEEPEAGMKKILNHLDCRFEAGILSPDRLVDYAPMFRGDLGKLQSRTFHGWNRRTEIFFQGSRFAWKRGGHPEMKSLTRKVAGTLERFGYEV